MMLYKRGDIVLVLFPNSNLRSTNMITSNLSRAGHSSRVFVPFTVASGRQTELISASVIVTDNLVTVAETEISHAIGVWRDMAAVNDALRHTFGLQ